MAIVNKFCANMFPDLLRLAAVALTLPVHPADYEQRFSHKNHLKNCEENQLLRKRLDTLTLINQQKGHLLQNLIFRPPGKSREQQSPEEFLEPAKNE